MITKSGSKISQSLNDFREEVLKQKNSEIQNLKQELNSIKYNMEKYEKLNKVVEGYQYYLEIEIFYYYTFLGEESPIIKTKSNFFVVTLSKNIEEINKYIMEKYYSIIFDKIELDLKTKGHNEIEEKLKNCEILKININKLEFKNNIYV